MHITVPKGAAEILNRLHREGYEAYVVGGCVRDAMLGRTPDDWDITTNASPQEVKQLFSHTIDTGIQHGTVTVMKEHVGYEVTTYRVDGVYEDHRRPSNVSFTKSLKEDMLRRDFTINAMAYNEEEGVVDYFEGQEDLKRGIIRCVGEASHRFDEDALRVLRAMRFSAQLDFTIEEKTLAAMQEKAEYLRDISAERIRVELTKLLLSDHTDRLLTVGYKTGITKVIMPWFDQMLATTQENPHHCYDVGRHCLKAVEQIPKTTVLRYAALLHDVAKPVVKTIDEHGICHFYQHAKESAEMARQILRELKFDNDTVRRVKELIYWHDYNWGSSVNRNQVRRAASKIGADYMEELFLLQRADCLAQSTYMQKEKLALLDEIEACYKDIRKEGECLCIHDLAINGSDLIRMGMKPGKELGQVLSYLLEQVLVHPEWNEKARLMQLVKEKELQERAVSQECERI